MKALLTTIMLLSLCLLPALAGQSASGELREFSVVVENTSASFEIEVGGTMDPENVEITIENLGQAPVVDPRITVNGKFDWFDIHSMVNEMTADCTTDEEKALAIAEWIWWKRFQRSPLDESAGNPVRAMNGYGYGICGHCALWYMMLCKEAGLDARMQEIWGHTVGEVFYNGAWHFMDTNVKVYYLGRDNRTLASMAELEQDPWLIERTIHSRDKWVRQKDSPSRNREFVRYITTTRDNYVQHDYDEFIKKEFDMSYTLRPGERLVRWWKPVLEKYESRHKSSLAPQRYANGQLIWEPALDKVDVLDYLEVIENITTVQQDGGSPAIHVAEPHDRSYTRAARFTVPVKSAYPIVGARFYCKLEKDGSSSHDMANISFGTPNWGTPDLYQWRWGKGVRELAFDLDQKLLEKAPVYEYKVGFSLKANGEADPVTQSGLSWFKLVTDLQVSPHSLPALSLGKNVIRFRDSGQGEKKVKIIFKWREKDDNHPPETISKALYPKLAEPVNTLSPTVKWSPALDRNPGDRVTDYQVMVSLRPDCRWPLAMTLYRNVGSDKTEWKVPESFLNPGTTYYWKVRARDNRGAVGRWGKVFSFKTAAGAE